MTSRSLSWPSFLACADYSVRQASRILPCRWGSNLDTASSLPLLLARATAIYALSGCYCLVVYSRCDSSWRQNKEVSTLQDICKPEAPRLRKQLSAIVNFARHREHKVAFWIEAAEQTALAQEEAAAAQDARDRTVCRPHPCNTRPGMVLDVLFSGHCKLVSHLKSLRCCNLQEAELKVLLEERAAQRPVRNAVSDAVAYMPHELVIQGYLRLHSHSSARTQTHPCHLTSGA